MNNPLIVKLARWIDFSPEDLASLEQMSGQSHQVGRGVHLIREGDDPKAVFLILEGWACRYKMLSNGKRQIVGILLPGDLCDTHVFILDQMDHGILMLSPGRVVAIRRSVMLDVFQNHPAIAKVLWWATLVDEGILRDWIANIGGRSAYGRIAHLLCELAQRLDNVGLFNASGFQMPLNQTDIAEAVGLTPVHVNRMLNKLRQHKLIEFRSQQIVILDLPQLREAGDFQPSYLHAKRRQDAWSPFDDVRELRVGAGGR